MNQANFNTLQNQSAHTKSKTQQNPQSTKNQQTKVFLLNGNAVQTIGTGTNTPNASEQISPSNAGMTGTMFYGKTTNNALSPQ